MKNKNKSWARLFGFGIILFLFVGILIIQFNGDNNLFPILLIKMNTSTTESIPIDPPTTLVAFTPTITSTLLPVFTNTPTPTLANTPTPTVGVIDSRMSERDGMTLVYVPEGEFTMGADRSIGYQACLELFDPFVENFECYEEVYDDEEPVHTVWLDGYWMDQTEVTNAMFADFLNTHGNQIEWGETWLDVSEPDVRVLEQDGVWIVEAGYEDHPVTLVTWYGARSYCGWMGRRLPTEAEWEKAARGTNERIYPWGNEFNGDKLNFCDRDCPFFANPNYNDGYITTAPVGSFPQGASPYGVLDMAGNVREWVFDRYTHNYYEISPRENPDGPAESLGDIRVWRGGSWSDAGDNTRISVRNPYRPTHGWVDKGFRCVLSDEP